MKLSKLAFYSNAITLAFAVLLIVMEITLKRLSMIDVFSLAVISINVYIAYTMLEKEKENES